MEHLPFLSQEDFNLACNELVARCQQKRGSDFAMAIHKEVDLLSGEQVYVTILQQLREHKAVLDTREPPNESEFWKDTSNAENVEEIDEDDDMAFHHAESPSQIITASFSILLSPTYRVPVLYICLCGIPPDGLKGLHLAYQYLVPESSQQELSTIGVMGGLSMTNHPVTDVPCYFIHPCNTAHAMEELIGSRKISHIEYLQLWIGLVGGCVGLYLPKELAVGSC